jgi:cell division septum initiation protein DivIVA
MNDTLRDSKADLDELSALLARVRMPEYRRLQAQASLERAQAIADLLVRTARAVRSLASALRTRLLPRALERIA